MTFDIDMHGPQMMNTTDFGDPSATSRMTYVYISFKGKCLDNCGISMLCH